MLETIREYAAERLEASGEANAVRQRHADHFIALAEDAEPHLFADTHTWTGRLEPEHDNVRAALDHLAASGQSQLLLRLAGAVSVFWEMKGHNPEGRRRLEAALAADDRPTAARAKALNGAAAMALGVGDGATAKRRGGRAGSPSGTRRRAWHGELPARAGPRAYRRRRLGDGAGLVRRERAAGRRGGR